MLLESQLNDRTILIFDAESVGGIDKGAVSNQGHPDKIVPRTIEIVRALATQLATAAEGVPGPNQPTDMEVTFGVRVDSNAIVSIARNPSEGNIRVTLKWRADTGL